MITNLIAVCRNGKWGSLNEKGYLIIPCRYDEVGEFSELGYVAPVRQSHAWRFITRKGKEASFYIYDTVVAYYRRSYLVRRAGLWGFVNDFGQEVVGCQYEGVRPVDDESRLVFGMVETPVCRHGKWGLIDDEWREVLFCKYDDIRTIYNGQVEVKTGKKWEWVNFNQIN